MKNKSYNLVVTGQAFEHIEFFWLILEEVKRVLKPGGLLFIIVPSTGPVHQNPYYCYRFYADGMKQWQNTLISKSLNLELILMRYPIHGMTVF